MIRQAETAFEAREFNFADDEIGLPRDAVGDDGTFHAGQNRLHVRLIKTENDRAVKRDAIHKFEKHGLNFLERVVLIEMFAVDGGDDGDDGSEQKEGTIAFVRFHDHVITLADARIRACGVHAAANDESGIEARGGQHGSDERRGGGLDRKSVV